MAVPVLPRRLFAALWAGPVVAIFLSANLVNFGNLGFNVLFSRLMGPALFGQLATVLTLFLAVMSLLGAVQLAVSQRIATTPSSAGALEASLARLSRQGLVFGLVAVPVLIAATVLLDIGTRFGLASVHLLPLLMLCLPFALPLALARGVATGRLDAWRVILSAQIEMWVRLIGAVCAWQVGLGLAGVVAVLALSVLAGLFPLRGVYGQPVETAVPVARDLLVMAFPFALLQAGQVILMDGDVVLALHLLGAESAGQLAALGLFQRIQFFACFGLAAVLVPAVVAEVSGGRTPAAAGQVFALYAAVTGGLTLIAFAAPEVTLAALVGPAFLPAAPFLPLTSLAAAAFTLSFLLATYLAALGDRSGIWAIALACPVQIAAITITADSLGSLLAAKLACQLALAAWLLARAAWCSRPATSRRQPSHA
ncbi:MAG: hypothetical protein MUE52_01830 [Tabrizicola sp.]|jgi:O-antigen/teichoic acid export membrane protein|nr:hypothetical protein [Tabrizicola sp.]